MWISHRKEIRKLTFRALALRRSEFTLRRSDSLRRRANARNVSFRISLRWLIHIINPVDKTQLSLYILGLRSGPPELPNMQISSQKLTGCFSIHQLQIGCSCKRENSEINWCDRTTSIVRISRIWMLWRSYSRCYSKHRKHNVIVSTPFRSR